MAALLVRSFCMQWHLGFKTKNHTATYRGFDSWMGYYHWVRSLALAMICSTAHDRNIAWEQLASLLCLLSGYQSGCMQRPSLSLKTVEDA